MSNQSQDLGVCDACLPEAVETLERATRKAADMADRNIPSNLRTWLRDYASWLQFAISKPDIPKDEWERANTRLSEVLTYLRSGDETPTPLRYHVTEDGWWMCDTCKQEVVEAMKCTGCGATTISRPEVKPPDERCPVGDHCPCQTDTSELHRLIEDGWSKAHRLLGPDDSPYHWLKDIHAEWVEIRAGRRALKTKTDPGVGLPQEHHCAKHGKFVNVSGECPDCAVSEGASRD